MEKENPFVLQFNFLIKHTVWSQIKKTHCNESNSCVRSYQLTNVKFCKKNQLSSTIWPMKTYDTGFPLRKKWTHETVYRLMETCIPANTEVTLGSTLENRWFWLSLAYKLAGIITKK